MPWGVAAAAVAAAGSYAASENAKKGAEGAARTAQNAQDAAYYNNQANAQPYLDSGSNALTQINQLNSGNFSSFTESPDYQFALDQGLQGLDRSAAARGSLYSGGQSADILGYAEGLASQNYNNYYNRLLGLAQMGQQAGASVAGVNSNYANATGNIASNLSSATTDAQNSLTGVLSGLASNYLSNMGGTRSSSYGGAAAGNQWQPSSNWGTGVGTDYGSTYNFGNNLPWG